MKLEGVGVTQPVRYGPFQIRPNRATTRPAHVSVAAVSVLLDERPCAMLAGGCASCDVVLCSWTCCARRSRRYSNGPMVFANWEL